MKLTHDLEIDCVPTTYYFLSTIMKDLDLNTTRDGSEDVMSMVERFPPKNDKIIPTAVPHDCPCPGGIDILTDFGHRIKFIA